MPQSRLRTSSYVEGWYEGNGERMESALQGRGNKASQRVPVEGSYHSRSLPERGGREVRRVARIDYLEEAKFNGVWKITNVLWKLKPKPATQKP